MRGNTSSQCPRRNPDDAPAHDDPKTPRARASLSAPGPSTADAPSSPPATRARTPRAGATRSFAPARPGARLRKSSKLRALPHPKRLERYAPPLQSTPAPCSGRCSSPVARSTFQRPAQRVPPLASNPGLSNIVFGHASAPCRPRVPRAPAPHPRVQSLAARRSKRLRPCSSRRAHESNRRAARPGETPRSPPRNPLRRILHHHRQPQPLRLTLAKQPRPRLPSRVALNDNPNRYPESRSTPASTGSPWLNISSSAPASTPPSETCALNRAARPSASPASAESSPLSPRGRAAHQVLAGGWRWARAEASRPLGEAVHHRPAHRPPHPGAAAFQNGCEAPIAPPPQRRRPWAEKSHTSHSAPSSNRGRVVLPPPLRHTESSGKSSGRCAGVRSLTCSCGCRVFVTSNHLTGTARRLPFSLPPAPVRLSYL